ncbi:hypothetical protein M758_10G036800 [Ceratodon purpureus]|nr:hypothetical protein M758_10G036800 [Ceratodon purpureus]
MGISMQRGHWVGFCGVSAGAGRLDSGAGGARQRAGIESWGRIAEGLTNVVPVLQEKSRLRMTLRRISCRNHSHNTVTVA